MPGTEPSSQDSTASYRNSEDEITQQVTAMDKIGFHCLLQQLKDLVPQSFTAINRIPQPDKLMKQR